MGFFSSIIKGITGLLGDIVGFLIGVDFDDFDDQAQGALVNKQSNIDPIPVVYGKRKVGGVRVFVSTGGGKKNEYLYMAIVLSEGNIEAIDQIYVNDKLHTHNDYSGLILVDKKLGGDNQGYSSLLSGADDSWGTSHTLKGVAYLAIRIKYDQDVFGGIPEVQCVIRGRRVYDPRTSTTGYSNNPALCLRDYLTNSRYGKGLPTSAIDDTKFIAAANEYDGTETPYTGGAAITWIECNARLDTGKTVFDNVKEMLQGMRGLLPYTDGKYGLIVDKSEDTSSIFELTPDNILSDITVTDAGKGKRFNRVIAKFPNPAANWQMDSVTYPEKSTDSNSDFVTFLAEDNGEELIREINLNTITNLYQAREMARIVCEASRRNTRAATLTATSEAMDIAVGDVVRLEQPSLGWTGAARQLMRVVSTRIKDNGEVDLSLIEYNDIYSWVTGSEENDNQDTTLPDPFGIEAPTVPLTSENSFLASDGTVQPAVLFSWTAADDAFVSEYEVQWKLTSASDYTNFAKTSETSIELFGLTIGSEYTFRVRSINALGVRSGFVDTTRTLQGDITPPGDITLGAITSGIRSITVEWTNPTDLDYAFTEVHVRDTNVQPTDSTTVTAKVAGEEYIHPTGAGVETKYFFLRPVDFSGNTGNFTGTSNNSGSSVQADSDDITDDAIGADEINDDEVLHEVPSEGLTYYWPCNSIADVSGGGNEELQEVVAGKTGIHSGSTAPTLSTDSPTGKSIVNGTDNSGWTLLSDTDADALEGANGFAWSLWFKSDTTSGDGAARIIGRDASDGWAVVIDQSASGNQAVTLYGEPSTEAMGSLAQGEWHHFCLSEDGNGTISGYVNGELVSTESYTPVDSSRPVVIACNTETAINTASSVFEGKLTEIRAYNRALTAQEVRGLYKVPAASAPAEVDGDMIIDGSLVAAKITVANLAEINDNVGTITGGSVGGVTITSTKLYQGTGTFNNSNTGFYLDNTGQFSLKDKLSFNGTTLSVSGAITATSLTLSGTSIAESQLASGVQSSLGLADSALQDGDTSVNLGLDDGSIAGINITSTKLYAGTGDWGNSNTGFYLDNTGKFSLKDKIFFNPSNSLLTVDGNITADIITAKENLVVLGDLEASSMAAGSITRAMFSQDALDEIYGALATSVGGSNGDYKEASGNFTTSGGTVTVGTSSDKFDHGTADVVVEFLANHYFYATTNYTTAQAQATLNFEVSADGTFTDLTSATKTQTLQFEEYDLSSYYGTTTLVYSFNGEHSKTFTTGSGNDIPDSTELQFRVRVTGVGTAFTGQTVPFTVEANEGVTGVVSTGGNADTLDNLDSTKFLRSDVNDTFDADLTITGDLSLQGALNITGDINSYNVTDLDVTDKTITVNSGNTQSLSDGAGLIVDRGTAADASLTWDETNDRFDLSHPINVSGNITVPEGQIVSDGTSLIIDGDDGKEVEIRSARDIRLVIDDNNDDTTNEFHIYKHSVASGNELLTIDQSGNADFSGTISSGSITSSGNVQAGTTTGYLYAKSLRLNNGEVGDSDFQHAYQMIVDANDALGIMSNKGDFDGGNPFGIFFLGDNAGTTKTLGSGLVGVWNTTNFKKAHVDHMVGLYDGTQDLTAPNISVTGNLDVVQSIRHTGDTDTAINFFSDQVEIRTGGTPRLSITNSDFIFTNTQVQFDSTMGIGAITYSPIEGNTDAERNWLNIHRANDASYIEITNRTPAGKVVLSGGLDGGGGEVQRLEIEGGSSTKSVKILASTDLNLSSTSKLTHGTTTILDASRNLAGIESADIDGFVLENSAHRSGLLNIPQRDSANSYTGIQILRDNGEHWQLMASDTYYGAYEDVTGTWIWQATKSAGTRLYYNGAEKLGTLDDGVQITGRLTAAATNIDNAYNFQFTDSDADNSYSGMRIDYNGSDNTTLTADRNHIAFEVDYDVTSTGGDTSNEYRAYGISVDVRGSGDTDIRRGIYSYSETQHSAGTVSENIAIYGYAVADETGTGRTTNNYGGYFLAYENGTGSGGTNTHYGVFAKAHANSLADKDIGSMYGVYAEVEYDTTGATTAISTIYGVRSVIDNDSTDTTLTNSYLFHGSYEGTINANNAYGLYISGNVENYFAGHVRADQGYKVGTSTIIDASANLSNIGSITASGTHTFTANDVDFIVQDTTDTVTNYIWRQHSSDKLYLGTANAVVDLRSVLKINNTERIDMSGNATLGTISSGAITTTDHISLPDSKYLRLGDAQDFIIYHDGASNYIQTVKQDSDLYIRGNDGGTNFNALQIDMSANGNATFSGDITAQDLTLLSTSGHTRFTLGSRSGDPTPSGDGSYDFRPGMRVAAFEPSDGSVDGDADLPLAWTGSLYLDGTQTYATASSDQVFTFSVNFSGGTRWFAKVKTNDAESGNYPYLAVNAGTEYALEFADAPPSNGENDTDAWHVIDITDDVVTGSNTLKVWLGGGQKTYVLAIYVYPSTGIMLPNEPYESVGYFHKGIGVGDSRILDEDANLSNIGTLSSGSITTSGSLNFTANPAYIQNDQDNSGQIVISAKNSASQTQQVRWDAANNTAGAWRPEVSNISNLGLTNRIWNTLYINLIKHGASNDTFLDQNRNVTANDVLVLGDLDIQNRLRHNGNTDTYIEFTTDQIDLRTTLTSRLTITDDVTVNTDLIVEAMSPSISIRDGNNGGSGNAEGKILFKNTGGNAIGIGYTADVLTDSDLIISTDAGGTYGAYLGLDALAITDTQSDIILEPKTSVRIASGGLKIGTTEVISSVGRFYSTSSTVTKPAFSFDGDSNTGMYHMGADQIGFTIGGSNKVYIEDSTYVLNVLGAAYITSDLDVAGDLAIAGEITSGGSTLLTSDDYETQVCHLKTNVSAAVDQGVANEFTVNFNLEEHNDSTTFSHSSGVVTVATTGWYRVYANMVYQNGSASARNTVRAYVEKNGTEITSTATYDYDRGSSYGEFSNNKIETMLYLAANDTIGIGNYAENEDGVITIEAAECEFIVSSVSAITSSTNADTVDGLHASSFIRSDAADTASGEITFSSNIYVADRIIHNNDENTYLEFLGDRVRILSGNVEMIDCVESTTDYVDIIDRVRVTAGGDLECEGNITAYTSTSISDINQKENIQRIESPIEKIKAISGYTFDWKQSGEHSGGVIAQEIEQVMPDIVKEKSIRDGEKMKAVDYQAIIGLLVETVKDLNQRIEDLENGDD